MVMERIIQLENELKINALNIKKVQGQSSVEDRSNLRELLAKRSSLKDELLTNYRKEISVRITDDHVGDVCSF